MPDDGDRPPIQDRPLDQFISEHRDTGEEEFLSAHPHPFLLVAVVDPDADDENFETMAIGNDRLSELEEMGIGDGSRETLSADPPAPDDTDRIDGDETEDDGLSPSMQAILGVERRVYEIRRTVEDRPFPHVTIGRTDQNDIVLDRPQISKMHAYFKEDLEGRLTIVDAGSTNGTRVNGTPLGRHEPVVLRDGDQIALAHAFTAEFHTPAGLHRFLSRAGALG